MGRKGRTTAAAFVEALVETGVKHLMADLHVSEPPARAAMAEIARSICWQYARQFIYVPLDTEFELTKRDQRLWDAYGQPGPDGVRPYTAARVAQIAQEAEVTTVHLYRIFKLAKQREHAARQADLPGIDEPAKGV